MVFQDGRSGGVPQTVTATGIDMMPESLDRSTPRLSHGKPRSDAGIEQTEYNQNPTELFQWINYGNYQGAARHVMSHPGEAKIWIVCHGDTGDSSVGANSVKWRYLPLHLVCFNPQPSEELLRALLFTYPKAAKLRAHDGNLAIHFLLSVGCQDLSIIELLLNASPDSINKRDRKGHTLFQIVAAASKEGKISQESMMRVCSFLRQTVLIAESGSESNHRVGGEEADGGRTMGLPFMQSTSHPMERSEDTRTNRKKLEKLESKLDGALAERDALLDVVAQQKVQSATLADTVKALQKKLSTSSEKLSAKSSKMTELQTQVERLKIQLHERDTELEQMKADKGQSDEERQLLATKQLQANSQAKEEAFVRDKASNTYADEALRTRITKLELMLSKERAKQSGILTVEVTRKEVLLQARIDALERELLAALGAKGETNSIVLSGVRIAREQQDSLKEMNASLQKHIIALKERCDTLEKESEEKDHIHSMLVASEKKLDSQKDSHHETLQELDRSKARLVTIESQLKAKTLALEKEMQESMILQQRLSNMEHELSLSKTARDLLQKQAEDRSSKRKEEELQGRLQEMREEFNQLLAYVHDLSSSTYLREKCNDLQKDNEELRKEIDRLERDEQSATRIASLHSKLQEQTELAQSSKRKLSEYEAKMDVLNKTYSELRSVMGKNGAKYQKKIDSLTTHIEDLQRRNKSLIGQVEELTSENSEMRNGLALMMASDGKDQSHDYKELSSRLKNVAAFLVAVSALQRQIVQASTTEEKDSPGSDNNPTVDTRSTQKLTIVSPRNLAEVQQKENDLLKAEPDERDDIVDAAVQYESQVREAFSDRRDMTSGLGRQRDELESIAREMNEAQ